MADFFTPALIATGALVVVAYAWNLKQKRDYPAPEPVQKSQTSTPAQGSITYASSVILANHQQQFHSVEETIDEKGAVVFLVDYGNGSKVLQYHDPRKLL